MVGTAVLLTAAVANAEPCRREGASVICDTGTFDRIVSDLISAERDRDKLKVDLTLAQSDLATAETVHAAETDRLNALVIVWRNRANAGNPNPEPTFPKSRIRWAVGTGAAGAAAVATGVALLASGKPAALGWGAVAAGVGSLGVGVTLAF